MNLNIGFISTRFSSTDGVSLEASKWAEFFENNGHTCFWFAGQLDRDSETSLLVPEAHFQFTQNRWINSQILGRTRRKPRVTQAIHTMRWHLKRRLYEFIHRFDIQLLVVENALAMPMHVPLGLAITETIAETQLPTIAHHHDFYWERNRYAVTAVDDYLAMAFPPALPSIEHVVINSAAQQALAMRTGITATVVPNVMNFEIPPDSDTKKATAFRQALGLSPSDRMILQPTRVVRRKGIEHAIDLVKHLDGEHNKLVVSHEAGDEGYAYYNWLKDYAAKERVDLRFSPFLLADPLITRSNGSKETPFFTLWDIYPQADFITFPSANEGFGNAFLEAIYFKKPLLINRYDTFIQDIEPFGFDLIKMNGRISGNIIQQVKHLLASPSRRRQMVEHNYRTATQSYSYKALGQGLHPLLLSLQANRPQYKKTMMPKAMSADASGTSPNIIPFPNSNRADPSHARSRAHPTARRTG